MKKILLLLTIVGIFSISEAQKISKVKIENENDSLSYALGINIAYNLKSQDISNLNPLAIAKAFEDFYAEKALMTNDESATFIQGFFDKKEASKHEEIVKEGETFLKENAKKKGVITTKSGLQYMVIKSGSGKTPLASDNVEVHYEGRLINGTVFDSSYKISARAFLNPAKEEHLPYLV